MIFANIAAKQSAAFIERPPQYDIATHSGFRTAGRFFGQIFSFDVMFHRGRYAAVEKTATGAQFFRVGWAQNKARIRFNCMSQNKEIISTLNNLIETLKDGQEGFKQSAEGVDDPQLKSVFDTFSLQRSRFAGELQREVVQLGDPDPEDSSSAAGSMHRAWINIKSAVTNRDRHAILAEAERGEDSAVSAYKDAMEENLPAPIKEIVARQSADVKAAHDQIRNLRDTAAASK